MKKYISIIVLLTFFAAGCSEEVVVSSNQASVQNDYKLIKLPTPSSLQVNTIYTDSKQISGSSGGSLSISGNYSGGPFGTVTVNSTLVFLSGSFSGTKTISMTADDEYCASTFLPGMSFWKSGIYNITYTGIDVTGINPANVVFVYLKSNGELDYPNHDGIVVDQTTGKLQVINAKLNHFSRYGFINTGD